MNGVFSISLKKSEKLAQSRHSENHINFFEKEIWIRIKIIKVFPESLSTFPRHEELEQVA